jgi:hypothetical protein
MNGYGPNSAFIYQQYLNYSGGIHPTPEQFNMYLSNYYYYRQQQQQPVPIMYHYPQPPIMYPMPAPFVPIQNPESCVVEIKEQHVLQPNPVKDNRRNCELNMNCKDIYCLNFHHPRFSVNK